jgi:hypothetical protein
LDLDIIPLQFEHDDVRKILNSCQTYNDNKQKLEVFNDTYLVPHEILNKVVQSYEEISKSKINELLKTQTNIINTNIKMDVFEEEEEEEDSGRGKKGKKKATKKNPKKKNEKESKDDPFEKILPTEEEIWKQFTKIIHENLPTEEEKEVSIIGYLKPKIRQVFHDTKESIFLSSSADRTKQR